LFRRLGRLFLFRLGRLLLFRSRLRFVEACFQLFPSRRGGFNAVRRNFRFRRPNDGVKDELAKIVVAPVPVKMGAGEPEPSTAVFGLGGPSDVLGLTATRHDRGVAAVVLAPISFACPIWRIGGENRRDVLHVRSKTHVVVPLVLNLERLDTVSDRMVWQL